VSDEEYAVISNFIGFGYDKNFSILKRDLADKNHPYHVPTLINNEMYSCQMTPYIVEEVQDHIGN